MESRGRLRNAYILERFICVFGIAPDTQVVDKLHKGLFSFSAKVA